MNTKVFSYCNGAEDVYADPLAVYRKLFAALDGDPDAVLGKAAHEDPAVHLPARGQLSEAVRKAFDMAPFDAKTGAGATESDCLAAVWSFCHWLEERKKKAASTPTCAPPSASA